MIKNVSFSKRRGLYLVALLAFMAVTVVVGFAATQSFASGNTLVVKAAEDTFVSEVSRDADHSSLSYLQTGANPVRKSYVKFHVPVDPRSIQKAVFKIHTVTNSPSGFQLFELPSSWTDSALRYDNRPTLGQFIAAPGSFAANTWIQVDASSYVKRAGTFGFGIQSADAAWNVYDSAETATGPELLITYASTPSPTPTATPAQPPVTIPTPTPLGTPPPAVSNSLSLALTTPQVASGGTFTVSVHENSGAVPVNAVQANLAFDPTKLQYVSTDSTAAAFPLAAATVTAPGTLQLSRAVNGGAPAVTGDKIVATITFRALMLAGTTRIDFGAGSLVATPSARNILKTSPGLVVNVATPDAQAPTAPTNVAATASAALAVTLTWAPSTDNVGVVRYNITRGSLVIASVAGTVLRYIDATVLPGTTYVYKISAADATGWQSPQSAAVPASTIQPPAPDTIPPSPPGRLTVLSALLTQVNLTWTQSTDNVGIARYWVYRDSILIASLAASTRSYGDAQISAGSTHSYTVSAVDAAGNQSVRTASVTVTAHPPLPTGAALKF